jgi:Holliday junction resolvase
MVGRCVGRRLDTHPSGERAIRPEIAAARRANRSGAREAALSGRAPRLKGNRVEREIVEAHKKIGIHAERYPLSGSSNFRGSSHDLDVYPFGKDEAPFVFEVKARKTGSGFAMLERWIANYHGIFLRRDNAKPLVVLTWDSYVSLLAGQNIDVEVPDKGAAKGGPKESPESPTP